MLTLSFKTFFCLRSVFCGFISQLYVQYIFESIKSQKVTKWGNICAAILVLHNNKEIAIKQRTIVSRARFKEPWKTWICN
jgi:hypothetical protein